jgi:hypothetical protein
MTLAAPGAVAAAVPAGGVAAGPLDRAAHAVDNSRMQARLKYFTGHILAATAHTRTWSVSATIVAEVS